MNKANTLQLKIGQEVLYEDNFAIRKNILKGKIIEILNEGIILDNSDHVLWEDIVAII